MNYRFNAHGVQIELDDAFRAHITAGGRVWDEAPDGAHRILLHGVAEPVLFGAAGSVSCTALKTGCRVGVSVRRSGFAAAPGLDFSAVWQIDTADGSVEAEIVVHHEADVPIERLCWPAPFVFDKLDPAWYTAYPLMQGALIPNGYPQKIDLAARWELEAGYVYSRSAYMPWFGQAAGRQGYLCIVKTPFDAGFELCHEKGGDTAVSVFWRESLGELSYRRTALYKFYDDCDYNTFCADFRRYLIRTGELCTLREKLVKNPKAAALIGSAIVHTTTFQHIKPVSYYYGKLPEECVSFETRGEQLRALRARGLKKAYLHLDGWVNAGYDNKHPDVWPPAPPAGGEAGMRALCQTVHELGYQFGIHDQYRDYYLDAPSYDPDYSIVDADGKRPMLDIWFGGEQEFLCATFAADYVKRNFSQLEAGGIGLDGAYLDVFSCVKLDECYHPDHRMTREQCMKFRKACFDEVRSRGIIISSEEMVGWCAHDLDLVHHAPYANDAMPDETQLCGQTLPDSIGIDVPLTSLVYHDCVVFPWGIAKPEESTPNHESGFLHALLNGGIPYVNIAADEEAIHRAGIVSALNEKVALSPMVRHEFLGNNRNLQRTTFENGVTVTVDFANNTYSIGE